MLLFGQGQLINVAILNDLLTSTFRVRCLLSEGSLLAHFFRSANYGLSTYTCLSG